MLPRNREDIECSEVTRLAPRLRVDLRADAPNEFRPAAFRRKHAGQKNQFARLNSFHIGAERSGWHGELDGKFFQPLLCAPSGPECSRAMSAVAFDLVLIFFSFSKYPAIWRPDWRRHR